MSDLTGFLLARIAEDETVARNAAEYGAATWGNEAQCWNFRPPERGHVPMTPDEARHIGRYDPARVLADCMAHRALVNLHRIYDPNSPAPQACWECGQPSPCQTLRILASVYADHPDFDPVVASVGEDPE